MVRVFHGNSANVHHHAGDLRSKGQTGLDYMDGIAYRNAIYALRRAETSLLEDYEKWIIRNYWLTA